MCLDVVQEVSWLEAQKNNYTVTEHVHKQVTS